VSISNSVTRRVQVQTHQNGLFLDPQLIYFTTFLCPPPRASSLQPIQIL
jgi:hypothetical protein